MENNNFFSAINQFVETLCKIKPIPTDKVEKLISFSSSIKEKEQYNIKIIVNNLL